MTSEQITRIVEMARQLPQNHQTVMRRVRGSELLGYGIERMYNREVDAESIYLVRVMVATNNVRALKRIAEKKGWNAMLDFVQRAQAGIYPLTDIND